MRIKQAAYVFLLCNVRPSKVIYLYVTSLGTRRPRQI